MIEEEKEKAASSSSCGKADLYCELQVASVEVDVGAVQLCSLLSSLSLSLYLFCAVQARQVEPARRAYSAASLLQYSTNPTITASLTLLAAVWFSLAASEPHIEFSEHLIARGEGLS